MRDYVRLNFSGISQEAIEASNRMFDMLNGKNKKTKPTESNITKEECLMEKETNNPEECICFGCSNMPIIKEGKEEYDCACDDGPVYLQDRCSECKHQSYCDVSINPELYPGI